MKKYIRIIAFVLAIGLLLISVLSAKAESFPMPYEEFNGTPMPEEIGESSEPYGVEDLGTQSEEIQIFPMPYEEFNGTPMPEEIGESSEPYGVEDLGIEIFLDYNWYLTK